MEEDVGLDNGKEDMASSSFCRPEAPANSKMRMTYNRVVLHDLRPAQRDPRVFLVTVKKSGFDQAQVDKMNMTKARRTKPRLLHIYSPPRYFNVLCKVETACSNKEGIAAVHTLSGALTALIKAGKSVEDAVADLVTEFPGHVKHGVHYQAKGLPERRTIRRYDRNALFVSESDDVNAAHATTDGEGNTAKEVKPRP